MMMLMAMLIADGADMYHIAAAEMLLLLLRVLVKRFSVLGGTGGTGVCNFVGKNANIALWVS